MLKIEIREGENIERAIKRYRRKFKSTKVLDELRKRQHYTKKSKKRREEVKKAIYREKYLLEREE